MPVQQKLIVFVIAFLAIFLFLPKKILAQVVINEFLPNPKEGPDWVELYNTTNQDISLVNWVLDDEGTKTNMAEIEEVTMSAYGFWLFEVGSRLNKTSDTIYLIDNQGMVIDEYCYSSNPGDDISFGRMPDGGEWGVCNELTPESKNKCILLSPSPSPSLETSPSPTASTQLEESPSPNISPSPKPVKITGATLLGKILGEGGTSTAGFFPWEATEEAESQEATENSRAKFIPKLFLSLGLVFLVVSGVYLWYNLTKGRII